MKQPVSSSCSGATPQLVSPLHLLPHQQCVCMRGISWHIALLREKINAQTPAMPVFSYKPTTLAAKEIGNCKMQKAALGDSRKFFRQEQSLGSTCTSARLSKRRERSRWPDTQESRQGKQAQKWEEEAWSKEGERFGPFGIFVCNKDKISH